MSKQRNVKSFLVFCCISMLTITCIAEENERTLEGRWFGKLQAGSLSLRTGLEIRYEENAYHVDFYSLDQTDAAIPMENVTFVEGILSFEKPGLRLSYSGTMIEDGAKLKGIAVQGLPRPLILERVASFPELVRPQTPQPPFDYATVEVDYLNVELENRLAGTLTIPHERKKFTAAILITGSGLQDRDETILGHKPFWVIADFLTRNGIAVLRVDDRGVGGSEAGDGSETSVDFASDVAAGVAFLRAHPRINKKKIWLIGHSEGGYIAPMVAAKDKKIEGIVSLAGTAVTGKEILMVQNRLIRASQGVPEETLDWFMPLYEELTEIAVAESDLEQARLKSKAALERRLGMAPLALRLAGSVLAIEVDAIAQQLQTAWMKYFLVHDPAKDWQMTRCHVLAVFGEKDLQVSSRQNAPVLAELLSGRARGSYAIIEDDSLNHLMQHAETGAIAEYGTIEETIAEDVLNEMLLFILGESR